MTDSLPYAHLEKHNAAFLRKYHAFSCGPCERDAQLLFQNGWTETRKGCWPPAGWAVRFILAPDQAQEETGASFEDGEFFLRAVEQRLSSSSKMGWAGTRHNRWPLAH